MAFNNLKAKLKARRKKAAIERKAVNIANAQIRRKARAAALREREKLEVQEAIRREKARIEKRRTGGTLGAVARVIGKGVNRATAPRRSTRRSTRRAPVRTRIENGAKKQKFNQFGIPIMN